MSAFSILGGVMAGYNKDKEREAELAILKEKMKLQSDIELTKRGQNLEDKFTLLVKEGLL